MYRHHHAIESKASLEESRAKSEELNANLATLRATLVRTEAAISSSAQIEAASNPASAPSPSNSVGSASSAGSDGSDDGDDALESSTDGRETGPLDGFPEEEPQGPQGPQLLGDEVPRGILDMYTSFLLAHDLGSLTTADTRLRRTGEGATEAWEALWSEYAACAIANGQRTAVHRRYVSSRRPLTKQQQDAAVKAEAQAEAVAEVVDTTLPARIKLRDAVRSRRRRPLYQRYKRKHTSFFLYRRPHPQPQHNLSLSLPSNLILHPLFSLPLGPHPSPHTAHPLPRALGEINEPLYSHS